MNALHLLMALGRGSLILAAAVLLVEGLLRWAPLRSPRWHRTAWGCVLLTGIVWLKFDVQLPWFAPPAARPDAAGLEVVVPPPMSVETVRENLMEIAPRQEAPNQVEVLNAEQAHRDAGTRGVGPGRVANIPAVICGVWIVGMFVLVLLRAASYSRFLWGLRRIARPASGDWATSFQQLLAESALHKAPRLLTAHGVGPLLCHGLRGPLIVVPADEGLTLNPLQRHAILAHELAHWQRRDLWTALLARLVALPQWFHPAAAWAVRRFEESAEWACDDAAAQTPESASELAKVLLRLGCVTPSVRWLPSAARRSTLGRRIERLVNPVSHRESTMKRLAWCAALCGILATAAVRVRLVAQEAEPETRKTTDAKAPESAAAQAPKAKPPREELRYDGKPFEYWAEMAREDLSFKVRQESLQAMWIFGRNGYGVEAVEVVFDIGEDYPDSQVLGSGMRDRPGVKWDLLETILRDLLSLATERIAQELDSPNATRRRLAASALVDSSEVAARYLPQLARAVRDDDEQTASIAIRVLAQTSSHAQGRETILNVLSNDTNASFVNHFGWVASAWPADDRRLADFALGFFGKAKPDERRDFANRLPGMKNFVSLYVKLLEDPDSEIRGAAIQRVEPSDHSREYDPRVVQALIRSVALGGEEVTVLGIDVLARYATRDKMARDFIGKLYAAQQVPEASLDTVRKALANEIENQKVASGVDEIAKEVLKDVEDGSSESPKRE